MQNLEGKEHVHPFSEADARSLPGSFIAPLPTGPPMTSSSCPDHANDKKKEDHHGIHHVAAWPAHYQVASN
jgi:hypothetical protein